MFKSGDFVEWHGDRYRVVGVQVRGTVVIEDNEGSGYFIDSPASLKLIEGCDSFDWKPKLLELWVNVYSYGGRIEGYAHESKEEAVAAAGNRLVRMIKVVEVKDV